MTSTTAKNSDPELDADIEQLARRKRRFAFALSASFLAYFTLLPILASYTTVLSGMAFGSLSLSYVYAFSLFPIGWIAFIFSAKQSKKIDVEADRLLSRYQASAASGVANLGQGGER